MSFDLQFEWSNICIWIENVRAFQSWVLRLESNVGKHYSKDQQLELGKPWVATIPVQTRECTHLFILIKIFSFNDCHATSNNCRVQGKIKYSTNYA